MIENIELKNSNNKNIQINCILDFTFNNVLYRVMAGEDGSIKVDEEYLPYATDSNGWLIQIEDVYMFETISIYENKETKRKNILIISSDGVIAIYRENCIGHESGNYAFANSQWEYKILLENDECYYEIIAKETTLVSSLLSLYINTEFSGVKKYTFDITN